MDFLADLIGDVIEALLSSFLRNPRIPRALRIGVVSVLFVPFIVLSVMMAISADSTGGHIAGAAVALFLLLFYGFTVRKILR